MRHHPANKMLSLMMERESNTCCHWPETDCLHFQCYFRTFSFGFCTPKNNTRQKLKRYCFKGPPRILLSFYTAAGKQSRSSIVRQRRWLNIESSLIKMALSHSRKLFPVVVYIHIYITYIQTHTHCLVIVHDVFKTYTPLPL